MEEFIVTTTENIEGSVIVKYLDPITANIVIGTSIISDLFAGFSDLLGTRSNTYQDKLKDMYRLAINKLKEETKNIGANCILGLKIDLDEISGKGMQMFMLNSIGTPVIIKSKEEYLKDKQEFLRNTELKKAEEDEKKMKYKTMEDILKDEEIIKKAKDIKRIYGEDVYESFLKEKAKELGIKL